MLQACNCHLLLPAILRLQFLQFFSHISEGHTARYVSITKKLAVSFKKKKKLAVPLHLYVVIYGENVPSPFAAHICTLFVWACLADKLWLKVLLVDLV